MYVHLKLLLQKVKPLISNYLSKRAELLLFYVQNAGTDEPLNFSFHSLLYTPSGYGAHLLSNQCLFSLVNLAIQSNVH